MASDLSRTRGALAALYAIGFLMLIDQAAAIIAPLMPFQLGNPQWRFGAFGMAMGHTSTVLFADTLIVVAAVGLEHRAWLRTWGAIHLLMAAVVGVLTAIFLLDGVQVRAQVQPAGRTPILLNTARVGLLSIFVMAVSIWLMVFAWRSTRRASRGAGGGALLLGTQPGAGAS